MYENPEKYKEEIAEKKRLNDQYRREREEQKRLFQGIASKGTDQTEVLKDIKKLLEIQNSETKKQASATAATAPPRRREPFKLPAENLNRGN